MKALPLATRSNWANLSTAFLGEFRPTDYIRDLKASMYTWSQEKGESVEEYVDRCRHIWDKMNLTSDEEQEDAKHFFIKGLRDNTVLEELFCEQDSLQECFTIALKHSKKIRVPRKRGAKTLTYRERELVIKDEVASLKEELSSQIEEFKQMQEELRS